MTSPTVKSAGHGNNDSFELASSTQKENATDPLAALMAKVAEGDEAAFTELYDSVSGRIYGIVLRVLRSPDQAAEVVQEVFVEVWRNAKRYEPARGGVLSWIATMAHRRAIDRVRSSESETVRDMRWALLEGRDVEPDTTWESAIQGLDAKRVQHALAQLSAGERRILTLIYLDEVPYAKASEMLQCSSGALRVRLSRALKSLRSVLVSEDTKEQVVADFEPKLRDRVQVDEFRRGLSALGDVEREVVMLTYLSGYSQSQTAALLKLPLGVVKTRLRDALIKLRDILQ